MMVSSDFINQHAFLFSRGLDSHRAFILLAMKDFAKTFYNSQKWRRCRKAYIQKRLQIDGGLCERCHVENGYIVHHTILLTPENIGDPEVSLNHDHLSYECKTCHDAEEGHWMDAHGLKKPNAMFDDNGNPIDIRRI